MEMKYYRLYQVVKDLSIFQICLHGGNISPLHTREKCTCNKVETF